MLYVSPLFVCLFFFKKKRGRLCNCWGAKSLGKPTTANVLRENSQLSLMLQLVALEYSTFGKERCTRSDFQVLQQNQSGDHTVLLLPFWRAEFSTERSHQSKQEHTLCEIGSRLLLT